MNSWTAARQRNCSGAGVLISFISAGAGTCKQVSADSVVELFHALLVMQRKSNARRRIKVILSPGSDHRGASEAPQRPRSQLCGSGCVWPGVNECEVAAWMWNRPWLIKNMWALRNLPPVNKMLKVHFKHQYITVRVITNTVITINTQGHSGDTPDCFKNNLCLLEPKYIWL